MTNGLTSLIHKKSSKFSRMLGEVGKMIKKNVVKKNSRATEQIGGRLIPGSGETDCRSSQYASYNTPAYRRR